MTFSLRWSSRSIAFVFFLLGGLIVAAGCTSSFGKSSPTPRNVTLLVEDEDGSVHERKVRAGSPSAYSQYLHAKQLEHLRRYAEAAQAYEKALQFEKKSAVIRVDYSQVLLWLDRVDEALEQAAAATRLEPNWAEGYYRLGCIQFSIDRFEQAIASFDKSIVCDPDFVEAYRRKGEVLYVTGNIEKLADMYREWTRRRPDDRMAWRYLVRLYRFERDLPRLEEALLKLLEFDPDDTDALHELVVWYERTRRYEDAARQLERIDYRHPDNPGILVKIAANYAKAGKVEEAQSLFDRARNLDGFSGRLHLQISLAWFEAKQYERAEKSLMEHYRMGDRALAAFMLGTLYQQRELFDEALKWFEEVATIEPDTERGLEALLAMATIHHNQGRDDLALRKLRTAERRFRDAPRYWLGASEWHRETGNPTQAIIELERGMASVEDPTVLEYSKAALLERVGQVERSLEMMEDILARQPDHANALNFIGYVLANSGKELDKAERYIRKAFRLAPDEGYIIDSLGWVLYRKGKSDKAMKWLSLALLLYPDEPEILYHNAVVLQELGRMDEVRDLLNQLSGMTLEPPELVQGLEKNFPGGWPRPAAPEAGVK